MKNYLKKPAVKWSLIVVGLLLLIIFSNLYLQWSQNDHSYSLAFKFAFSWHTEKFFLGCFVLAVLLLFLIGLAGSISVGALFYSIAIGVLGVADYLKMSYRTEPIYPDDLKMITEFSLLREMVGTVPFIILVGVLLVGLIAVGIAVYRSFFLPKRQQIARVAVLVLSIGLLTYITDFNNPQNLIRRAYNRTALWIPYSQKMNYYNTGFIGGFLYNLKVEPMAKPNGYSEAKIKEITARYQADPTQSEKPNIIYVMSESFSDPSHLNGVSVSGDPLAAYYQVADQTLSGRMLSQNYGGGTANIEFEALTSLSMEPLNAQLTTPYTMLVPKLTELPSLVSLLKGQAYQTTAIHPYNTSMYKRKDVYDVLGFDQFLNEDTMQHTDKIDNNPYISDAAAYQEIMGLLKSNDPQFIHLVTMQTHMPYGSKYTQHDATVQAPGDTNTIADYLQDVSYSAKALQNFLKEVDQLPRRTLVVFWGDHLPSIYNDEIKQMNDEATLHETQFLMYDNQHKLADQKDHEFIMSPTYFAPVLFKESGLPLTGFYQLVAQLHDQLPAFEKNFYYQDGQWFKEMQKDAKLTQLYQDYQMIQYDLVAGKQYSIQEHFFEEAK